MNREEIEYKPSFMDNPEISDCQKQFMLEAFNSNRTREEIIEDYLHGFEGYPPEVIAVMRKRGERLKKEWFGTQPQLD